MRRRAHGAVLARGVDRGAVPFGGRQLSDGPLSDRELGVAGVVAVLDAVAILEDDLTLAIDEDRPERLVTAVECLAREFDTTA